MFRSSLVFILTKALTMLYGVNFLTSLSVGEDASTDMILKVHVCPHHSKQRLLPPTRCQLSRKSSRLLIETLKNKNFVLEIEYSESQTKWSADISCQPHNADMVAINFGTYLYFSVSCTLGQLLGNILCSLKPIIHFIIPLSSTVLGGM